MTSAVFIVRDRVMISQLRRRCCILVFLLMMFGVATANEPVATSQEIKVKQLIADSCSECHNEQASEGGLNLEQLPWNLENVSGRQRWVRIFDRIAKGEMPPDKNSLAEVDRKELLSALNDSIGTADRNEILAQGRGPLRRLNREEYESNLRDLLLMPDLELRQMLPEDRKLHGFNKSVDALDFSRVQLDAYLDAAQAGLQAAVASGERPPAEQRYHALATRMFPAPETFGTRRSMYFARDNKLLPLTWGELGDIRTKNAHDPAVELAIFRSASWPYFGYPVDFVVQTAGEYRVRFSARSVLQQEDYQLLPATTSIPMTFRARAPGGPDILGDIRAVGGVMDVLPERTEFETKVRLSAGETIEYSLLGLPVPTPMAIQGDASYYIFPPMPEGGHPGIAFSWIEITGPISSPVWPPASHRVLFGDLPLRNVTAKPDSTSKLPVEIVSADPSQDAGRLFRRFVEQAARYPVPESTLKTYEQLIQNELTAGTPFAEAMLIGYKAFLCSGHFLYLREPQGADDCAAVASRLSHFLWNSRPDAQLLSHVQDKSLARPEILRAETDRLIDAPQFERFVESFTDDWLDLKQLRRDLADIRLYPEYRMDDYLIQSMGQETRTFFSTMIRKNLPARVLVSADFAFVNDRLSRHYGLQPVSGSQVQKVLLPETSPYGGLLTQGAILKVTSNGTSTSPVIRGAWVMDRLLGDPPPPPPPVVPAVEPDLRGAKTIRDLLALHTKSNSCAACHKRFDPVGLSLENFDVLGAWRDRYRGLESGERVTGVDRTGNNFAYTNAEPVDSKGQLLDGSQFNDIHQLKAILAVNPRQLARNLLQRFTVYATGTPVRFSDRAEIEAILDRCAAADYGVRDLVGEFVKSSVFLGQARSNVADQRPLTGDAQ